MLSKVALLVKSKVAIAVLGVLVAGTGGTAALAATGHLPNLPVLPNVTQTAHSQQNAGNSNDNSNHGHTVSIEGTLEAYDATAKTISVRADNATTDTTVGVNDQTNVNGAKATQLSDLTANIGHKVQVQATKQDDGSLVAWKITVEGATGDHGQGSNSRHDIAGTITSVTATGFVVKTATGDTVTVVVNAQTTFAGVANVLAKVKTGMHVEVHGTTQPDGSLLAESVRIAADGGQGSGQGGGNSGSGH